MTVRRPHALAALALAALAATLPVRARADAPERRREPPPAAELPPPGAERIEIDVVFPDWQYTGTFRLRSASGATLDEGVARDMGGFPAGGGVVERVLEGGRGTLRMRLTTARKGAALPVVGRWTVLDGTGAYASFAAKGTFTSCSSGKPGRSSMYEQWYMLGHAR
ncbi:hypothetical protein ACOQFB_00090 [Anaeromyxobacter sp. Red801]|uniref:hypothetical protein n=1 Tax=Anaeromyxobacter sp. Red801 TaxID=3411632 RepID=UPI003B9FD984